MSQCSFIGKAVHGCMIPFLFALASLQVAQANAESGCFSDEEQAKDRLFFSGAIQLEYVTPPDLTIKVYMISPCGDKEKLTTQRVEANTDGSLKTSVNFSSSSSGFPAIRGEYKIVTIIHPSSPKDLTDSPQDLTEMTFTATHFITESRKGQLTTQAVEGISRKMLPPPVGTQAAEIVEFQYTDTYQYRL
jgi:hypothetical protein